MAYVIFSRKTPPMVQTIWCTLIFPQLNPPPTEFPWGKIIGNQVICHGESTRNSRFVDTNVRGPKARVHLYYESTVPSAFSDLKYCLLV